LLFPIRDKLKDYLDILMSRICTKCKIDIPDAEQLEPQAEKYPTCSKCWEEWKEMRIMVMNEMHLDMSMADHRKVLRKHEKMFVGIMTPEGDYVDYTNEDNRNPEDTPS
jgi:Fe-S cluster biosynthesis and repair protein YggX